MEVWKTTSDHVAVRRAGVSDERPAATYFSLRQVADDWLVRCDREQRRHRQRSPARLEEMSIRYWTAARDVRWRYADKNDAVSSPPVGLLRRPAPMVIPCSRLRVAAHVRDLAWRNLWFALLESAADHIVVSSNGATALAADSKSRVFWTDAVVEQAPIAVAWIRQGRRSHSASAQVSNDGCDSSSGGDGCDSSGGGDGCSSLSGRRRLVSPPITLKSVTWLLHVARLTVCDGWRLHAPVLRSSTVPLSYRVLPPPAISVEGLARILRAASVEAAAGRVHAHLGRWRDAAGYLRRALDAMLGLRFRSRHPMHKSWRFFETCVHLLDALHATGQHHSAAMLTRCLEIFCSRDQRSSPTGEGGQRSSPTGEGGESHIDPEVGAFHLEAADRALGKWSRRLSVQCAMVNCLRFLRTTRVPSFGEPKRAAHVAEMEQQVAQFSAKLRALAWRGPIWHSVIAARSILATCGRRKNPPPPDVVARRAASPTAASAAEFLTSGVATRSPSPPVVVERELQLC